MIQNALAIATGSDPERTEAHGPLDRLYLKMINDPRDLPFVRLIVSYALFAYPAALLLFWPGQFRLWLAIAYLAINFLVFVDRNILMLHNTSHRVLFKPKYRWFNQIIPWFLGPFFGEAPVAYFGHHMGMHHIENNLPDDLSSTMRYKRDRFDHFLRYFFSFLFTGLATLTYYLATHKRNKLAVRTAVGELSFWVVSAIGCYFNLAATLTVFVIPLVVVRFLMMMGNWGQHAFVLAKDPGNSYVNSITCIDSRYNRRCFNDGYHIGHHIKANRHWTEMPKDFRDNVAAYHREGSIVFRGIDFFMVSLYLFTRQYKTLARCYVQLTDKTLSESEIIALLRSRVQPILQEETVTAPQAEAA